MKVLKFGGTSVGTIEALTNVKTIVEAREDKLIVVVSALGGLTDNLIATAKKAQAGEAVEDSLAAFAKRHHDIIDALVPAERQGDVRASVDAVLAELAGYYTAIAAMHELSDQSLNNVVACGERMSSVMVANIIRDAVHVDSLQFIKTRRQPGANVLDAAASYPLIDDVFSRVAGAKVVVAGGFISTDSTDGMITNLGRGGSDYTAAILAAQLGAEVLEIWTDVDGFMTADPRLIPQAQVVERMSFVEAMDLCNFGAKIIYPPTIYPVFNRRIPIILKNTKNPSAPGTLITDSDDDALPIKGVSAIRDTAMLTLTGDVDNVKTSPTPNSRIFNAMGEFGVTIFPLIRRQIEDCVAAFAVKAEAMDIAMRALAEEFAPEWKDGTVTGLSIERSLATIAVVGRDIQRRPQILERLTNILTSNGISILANAGGTSSTSVSFVIAGRNLQKAIEKLHEAIFVSRQTTVINPELFS